MRFTVRELGSEAPLLGGECVVDGDAATVLGTVPAMRSHHRFLVIDWESDVGRGRNHYLAGNPPFDSACYRRWLEEAYGALAGVAELRPFD